MHKRILIAIDDTEVSRPAVDEGLVVARSFGAEVVFYYVLPSFVLPLMDMPVAMDASPVEHYRAARKAAGRVLAAAAVRARRAGVRSSEVMGSGGIAADCIAQAARGRKCDMIVVGSHGRSTVQRLIFGSVVTQLITLSPVPVLVCKKAEGARAGSGNVKKRVKRPRASHGSKAVPPYPRRRPRAPVTA